MNDYAASLARCLEEENEIRQKLLRGEISAEQAEHDLRNTRHVMVFLMGLNREER